MAALMADVDTAKAWLQGWFWGEVLVAALEVGRHTNPDEWLAAVNVLRADLERRQAERASTGPTSP